jgi:hypothetical protein
VEQIHWAGAFRPVGEASCITCGATSGFVPALRTAQQPPHPAVAMCIIRNADSVIQGVGKSSGPKPPSGKSGNGREIRDRPGAESWTTHHRRAPAGVSRQDRSCIPGRDADGPSRSGSSRRCDAMPSVRKAQDYDAAGGGRPTFFPAISSIGRGLDLQMVKKSWHVVSAATGAPSRCKRFFSPVAVERTFPSPLRRLGAGPPVRCAAAWNRCRD